MAVVVPRGYGSAIEAVPGSLRPRPRPSHAYRLAADDCIVKPIARRALVEQLLPVRRRGSRG